MGTNVIEMDNKQLKQKALDKMLEEMNEKHSAAEDRIHGWLCNQEDEDLWNGILLEDKSIRDSYSYCRTKAKELADDNVAMVEDDDVFNWVKEYFTTKDLKVESRPRAEASTDNTPVKVPELTEVQKYIEQNKKTTRKKKSNDKGVEQISLLD